MSWISPNGTPLTDATLARVDLAVLAQLYAEESTDRGPTSATWDRANPATQHAWNLGYMNPRIEQD